MKEIEFPIISSVAQNIQSGYMFSIESARFIVHKSGFSYLDGNLTDNSYLLDFFIEEDKLPQYFHIYNPPIKLVELIKKDDRFGIKYRKRIQLKYLSKNRSLNYINTLPNNYSIIDIDITNFHKLSVFELDIENRFWSSKEDFFSNGYGKVILYKDTAVALCYSSAVADGVSEIDIATQIGYRGRGFAKVLAEAYIEESIKRGITANWDCFVDNTPSIRTAKSLGFGGDKEYMFLSIFKKVK